MFVKDRKLCCRQIIYFSNIAPCIFIALNLLWYILGIISLNLFSIELSKVIDLRGDSKKIFINFAIAFMRVKERQLEQ